MALIAITVFAGIMVAGSGLLWLIEKAVGEEYFNDENTK